MRPLDRRDLDHVLEHTAELWEGLRGRRVFVSGGTGFFGIWLVESFLHANARFGLDAEALVLSRDPGRFLRRVPHLAGHAALGLLEGDMGSFVFPRGEFACVIHAAAEMGHEADPQDVFDHNVGGTRRVLEFAREAGAGRVLLLSSGAVYGRQTPDLSHLPEDHEGAPATLDTGTAYAQSKRVAEFLGALQARRAGIVVPVARCFAFVGPHMPLDAHWAAGNFIRDRLAGGPIRVQGDGTPRRSYLYAADLAIWLWTILMRGSSARAYNVGSEEDVSIAELAQVVAATARPPALVTVSERPKPGQAAQRYVPATGRAREELGLSVRISLAEGIRRTLAWHTGSGQPG